MALKILKITSKSVNNKELWIYRREIRFKHSFCTERLRVGLSHGLGKIHYTFKLGSFGVARWNQLEYFWSRQRLAYLMSRNRETFVEPDELNMSTSTCLIPFQEEQKSAKQSRRIIKSAKNSLSKTKSCFPGRLSRFLSRTHTRLVDYGLSIKWDWI